MKPGIWVAGAVVCMVSACGGGGGGGDSSSPTTPAVTPKADVSISAAGPNGSVPSGSAVQVDITVTNAGPGIATDMVVAPNLSTKIDRGAVSCTASGAVSCPALSEQDFHIASLPAGAALTFRIQGVVGAGASGPLASVATVTATNDLSSGNNAATAVVNSYSADVSVTASGPGSAVPAGSVTSYSATVSNAGPDAARGVAISDWLSAGQLIGSITCTAGGGATCPTVLGQDMTVAVLPMGASLQFTVVTTVPPATSGSISHGMFVSSAGDPQSANNYAAGQGTAVYAAPAGVNAVELQSDGGDYIGQGASYTYTQTNSVLGVSATGGHLVVTVAGEQGWHADFGLPGVFTQLQPGIYTNLTRYAFRDPAVGGIEWNGEGRGCNSILGSLTIDSVQYVSGQLASISLSFEQHCEGATAALRGQVRWSASDSTSPPGPVSPPPTGLWAPASGSTPAAGSYVYLQSDPFEYVARGATYTYTKANAVLTATVTGGLVAVQVTGDQTWYGSFQAMNGVAQLQPGYYGALSRYPLQNPARGGIDWFGEGRGCNREEGWFIVDGISYVNGLLATLDLRFEKHCEGSVPALRGQIHWDASDATVPPGPVSPPPADLWTPAAGATPATGNYVYLVSDPGDFAGGGRTSTYTPANATVTLRTDNAHLTVSVAGTESYTGDFLAMNTLSRLQPGYYAGLERYPFNNPTKGGLAWGQSCNTLSGWFVVDSVAYSGGAISAIDLRFEQHCDGGSPALRGKIHWTP